MWRCRLTVSKPVFKPPMVSVLETRERDASACMRRHQAFALAPMVSALETMI